MNFFLKNFKLISNLIENVFLKITDKHLSTIYRCMSFSPQFPEASLYNLDESYYSPEENEVVTELPDINVQTEISINGYKCAFPEYLLDFLSDAVLTFQELFSNVFFLFMLSLDFNYVKLMAFIYSRRKITNLLV